MSLDPLNMYTEPTYHGDGRVKLPVIGSDGGTPVNGNATLNAGVDFPIPGRELFIINNSGAPITILVNCNGGTLGFNLANFGQFDERLPTFTSVQVQATGNWFWRVRGNLQ